MIQVTADPTRCVGAGQCVLAEPSVFDQNEDDGTVIVLDNAPTDEQTISQVRQAIHLCPSRALALAEQPAPARTDAPRAPAGDDAGGAAP
ncbi:ferredoxin [Plantactinospora sonchi]|uniref:Ferredoxin n=1 Tax=Plantactinospora sonchi TaxID=1544735 RepID=A0ABU7S316_9ACTN